MIRTKPFWIGLALALCCLLVIVILTSPREQAIAASPQTNQASATPTTSYPSSLGMPAIHPPVSQAASVSIARFTTSDVQAYLKTHPFVGGPVVNGTTASITDIQFISSTQASTLMHGEETGLSPTSTVCYVKFQGPFTLATAPTAPGAKQLPPAAYGVEIFDAQTGNLLMWWTPTA